MVTVAEHGEGRRWSSWLGRGSLAMASLAALSLAATVYVAQRALSDASDIVVRGEADALLRAVASDLAADGQTPVTRATLERELETHAAAGLRYVAIVERHGRRVAEAGSAQLPDGPLHPGESTIIGERVRMTGMLGPPPRRLHDARPDGLRVPHDRSGGVFGMPPDARRPHHPPPMHALVVELEPPVIQRLRAHFMRLSVVAAVAAGALLAFAVAWSRNARRLATVQIRAAREQRLVALGSMSSVMAHELRNPLASLKGHAQLLVEDLSDVAQRRKAERVVTEAERLELLTTSLLDFVRDGPIERRPTPVAELVTQALEHLPASRVAVDTSGAPESIFVDAPRLGRALHNLLDNALQVTDGERMVDLSISRENEQLLIAVRDRGPGLAPGAQAQIFEPFVTTRVRGTGLGLAVARRIAEQHGGTLTAENHVSGGAVFQLSLPLQAEAE